MWLTYSAASDSKNAWPHKDAFILKGQHGGLPTPPGFREQQAKNVKVWIW